MRDKYNGHLRSGVAAGALGSILVGIVASAGCSSGGEPGVAEKVEVLVQGLGHGGSHRGPPDGELCTLTTDGRTLKLRVEIGADARDKAHHRHGHARGNLVLVADRELDMTTPGRNVLSESAVLRRPWGPKFLSYSLTSLTTETTHIEVDWGSLVEGADTAVFDIQNGVMTGNIDGREFAPFPIDADPASGTFLDGGPSPRLHARGLGPGTLEHLRARVERAMAECERSGLEQSSEPFSQAIENQDPGHFSPTYDTLECDGCKGAVVVGGSAAGIACCATTLGLGCGACLAGVAAGVAAGIAACESSNSCCPVACGRGLGSTCCFGDETCLNGAGLCCSPGKQPCAALACCGSDQSCIDVGPQKGTCCPDASVCGQSCCESGEVCLNSAAGQCCAQDSVCGSSCCESGEVCQSPATGQCCAPDKLCGSACCGSGELGIFFCANPALGLCCQEGHVECGGQCCGGPNRECRDGQCVLRQTIDCSGATVCVDPATGEQIVFDCPPSSNNDPGFCNLGTGCCDILGAP